MTMLNGANQMNNKQLDAATMLRGKAGDNQAMITMADTMTGDSKANENLQHHSAPGSSENPANNRTSMK
jgi:hypothetical protein